MKFTKGPWEILRSPQPVDGEYDFAISAEGHPVLAEVFGRSAKGGRPPAEANAHLIAAAPEMLEALECLEKEIYAGFHYVHKDKVFAALAKARDEESAGE